METPDYIDLEYGLEDEEGKVGKQTHRFHICNDNELRGTKVILGGQRLANFGLRPCFALERNSVHLDNAGGLQTETSRILLEAELEDPVPEAPESPEKKH